MPTNVKLLSFGDRIKFTLDGTAITNSGGATVVTSGIKPDGTTPGDWKDFSTVEEGTIESKFSDEDVMSAAPGAYRRTDVFRSMLALDVKLSLQQVNEHILRSVLQSPAITDGTEFVVGGELGQVRGWLQITSGSQNDETVLTLELYGILSCKLRKADGKRFKPEVEFSVLYNTLNTGMSGLSEA